MVAYAIWEKCVQIPTPEANAKKGLRKEAHPKWKPVGSRRSAHSGYIEIKLPNGEWEYEHRVVSLAPKGMHVHHVDENTANNDPANLQLLTPGDHNRIHRVGCGGNWSFKYSHCQDCGTSSRKHEALGLCTACYQRLRYHRAIVNA